MVDHLRTATVRYARAIAADAVVDAWLDRELGPALSRVFEATGSDLRRRATPAS